MGSASIVQYFEHKTILITGGTGFLAKIFLEKILRIQPNVSRIYLLVRAPDNHSATKRVYDEVMAKDLFKVLRDKVGEDFNLFISEKVIPVSGDISKDDSLGIQDYNIIEEMWKNLDIIVNFAATTNFDERYDVSMGTNTWGALHVLNFAKKCVCLKMLLHVSTAYVCGKREGLIQENPFKMGETLLHTENTKLDINIENKLVEQMLSQLRMREATDDDEDITFALKKLGIERARLHGWPNTYVFTKAMGEMLLGHFKDDVPIAILRPAMISSTYIDPFPGWIEGLRTIDGIIGSFLKGKIKFLPCDPQTIIDALPADMVVNSIIVAIVDGENKLCNNDTNIYQVGSSLRNPVTFESMQEFSISFGTKNPLKDKNGEAIVLERVGVFSTMATFRMFMAIRYQLPLKVLGVLSMAPIFGHYLEDMYVDFNRKLKSGLRLAELFGPYMFFRGIFDDTNSEKLRMATREMGGEDEFNFDPMSIDWEKYMIHTHIPGLLKYVLK